MYEALRRLRPGVPLRALHGKLKQSRRLAAFYDFCEVRGYCFWGESGSKTWKERNATHSTATLRHVHLGELFLIPCCQSAYDAVHTASAACLSQIYRQVLLLLCLTQRQTTVGQPSDSSHS